MKKRVIVLSGLLVGAVATGTMISDAQARYGISDVQVATNVMYNGGYFGADERWAETSNYGSRYVFVGSHVWYTKKVSNNVTKVTDTDMSYADVDVKRPSSLYYAFDVSGKSGSGYKYGSYSNLYK